MLNKIEAAGSTKSTFYTLLGGTENVRILVEAFYDTMQTDPKAATILALHPVAAAFYDVHAATGL